MKDEKKKLKEEAKEEGKKKKEEEKKKKEEEKKKKEEEKEEKKKHKEEEKKKEKEEKKKEKEDKKIKNTKLKDSDAEEDTSGSNGFLHKILRRNPSRDKLNEYDSDKEGSMSTLNKIKSKSQSLFFGSNRSLADNSSSKGGVVIEPSANVNSLINQLENNEFGNNHNNTFNRTRSGSNSSHDSVFSDENLFKNKVKNNIKLFSHKKFNTSVETHSEKDINGIKQSSSFNMRVQKEQSERSQDNVKDNVKDNAVENIKENVKENVKEDIKDNSIVNDEDNNKENNNSTLHDKSTSTNSNDEELTTDTDTSKPQLSPSNSFDHNGLLVSIKAVAPPKRRPPTKKKLMEDAETAYIQRTGNEMKKDYILSDDDDDCIPILRNDSTSYKSLKDSNKFNISDTINKDNDPLDDDLFDDSDDDNIFDLKKKLTKKLINKQKFSDKLYPGGENCDSNISKFMTMFIGYLLIFYNIIIVLNIFKKPSHHIF